MSWRAWRKQDCCDSMSYGSKATAALRSTAWMTGGASTTTTPAMTRPGRMPALASSCSDFQSKTPSSAASSDTTFCEGSKPTNSIGPIRRAGPSLFSLRATACPQCCSSRAKKRARQRALLQKLCCPRGQPSLCAAGIALEDARLDWRPERRQIDSGHLQSGLWGPQLATCDLIWIEKEPNDEANTTLCPRRHSASGRLA